MTAGRPFAKTRLVVFLRERIKALRGIKTQAEIAAEAGFNSVNMLAIIKAGGCRLPIDRVQALAAALDVDPARLFLLALEQDVGDTTARAILEIIGGTVVSRNETGWLGAIREASDNTDPPLTKRSRTGIVNLLHKPEPEALWPRDILLTEREAFFVDAFRVATNGTDPLPTLELTQKLRQLFGKKHKPEDEDEK